MTETRIGAALDLHYADTMGRVRIEGNIPDLKVRNLSISQGYYSSGRRFDMAYLSSSYSDEFKAKTTPVSVYS